MCQLGVHSFEQPQKELYSASVYSLFFDFIQETNNSSSDFPRFAEKKLSLDICNAVEYFTRDQSSSLLWVELHFGRVTASELYEAANCKTAGGCLVKLIMEVSKKFTGDFMKRGLLLENLIRKEIEKLMSIKITKCGFFLLPSFAMLGASPDGVSEKYVVEIKSPSKQKCYKNYLKNGVITEKYKVQIQLQMLAAKKSKGLFCVADPDFENNKKVCIKCIDFDEKFIYTYIEKAGSFWNENIFPLLRNSVS